MVFPLLIGSNLENSYPLLLDFMIILVLKKSVNDG